MSRALKTRPGIQAVSAVRSRDLTSPCANPPAFSSVCLPCGAPSSRPARSHLVYAFRQGTASAVPTNPGNSGVLTPEGRGHVRGSIHEANSNRKTSFTNHPILIGTRSRIEITVNTFPFNKTVLSNRYAKGTPSETISGPNFPFSLFHFPPSTPRVATVARLCDNRSFTQPTSRPH